jgi:hypothetical protein
MATVVDPEDMTISAIKAEISELKTRVATWEDDDDHDMRVEIRLEELEQAVNNMTELQAVNKYIIENFLNNNMAAILASTETVELIRQKFAERNALIADLTRVGVVYTDTIDNTKLQALLNTELQALLDTIEKIENPNKPTGGRKSKKRKRRRKRKSKKTIKHK